jgi:hypothetical protein
MEIVDVCRVPLPLDEMEELSPSLQATIPPCLHTTQVPFYILRMTELHDVQGYSPSVPGTASARDNRLGGQIIRGDQWSCVCRVADSCVDAPGVECVYVVLQ